MATLSPSMSPAETAALYHTTKELISEHAFKVRQLDPYYLGKHANSTVI
jgi:hypothetical protein